MPFCLYAEDAGIFATKTSFEDYIKSFNLPNLRKAMIELFKGLDTKIEDRDKYDESLKPFPYVNGGLFKDEQIEIPNFTEEIVDVIVNHCAPFNWSEISLTIFGAVFESTLNPETRRKGGMHYTSIANIHKVIDPLFMDGLKLEFTNIMGISPDDINFDKAYITMSQKQKKEIQAFQEKLSPLTFLVSCWYAKAITLLKETQTQCAFVSTNSITQGEQVLTLWKYLSKEGLSIDFAWRTFRSLKCSS